MKFTGIVYPWAHHTVERFIPEEDFLTLKEKVSSWPKPHENKRRISMGIWRDDLPVPKNIPKDHPSPIIIYDNWIYDLLESRFRILVNETIQDRGIDLDKTFIMFQYVSCSAGYEYETHRDGLRKICSMVLYVSDEGDGTNIHIPNKEYHSTIKWVPNNGLFFYRGESTWHSYGATVSYRDTINCILIDTR